MIQAGDPFEVARERREGIVLAQRRAELPAQKSSLVRGREQAHVVEVRPLGGQAQVAQEELPAQRAGQSVGLRPGGGQRPEQPVAEPRRQSPAHAVLQHVEAIAPGVAAEGLVAAVPGERHGHPLTRGPREIIGGQGGRIGERLVEVPHERGKDLGGPRRDDDLAVVGLEGLRHLPGVRCLVEPALPKRHARGQYWPRRLAGHRHDDRGGVDAAAEECPEWHVADHAQAHGLGQESGEFLEVVPLAAFRPDIESHVPVLGESNPAVLPQEVVRRRQLGDALVDRPGGRNGAEGQVVVDRLRVDRALHGGILDEHLQLGGKDQALPVVSVVEGLLAKPVARQQQPPGGPVPQREGEHPAQPAHAVVAVLLPRVDDHFGVGRSPEAMPASDELGA